MAENKRKGRGAQFREAFASAKRALQIRFSEALSWIRSLSLCACSRYEQLGVRSLGLPDGSSVQIFEGPAGLVIFYSDGRVFYALYCH